jgi:hypothetical protein
VGAKWSSRERRRSGSACCGLTIWSSTERKRSGRAEARSEESVLLLSWSSSEVVALLALLALLVLEVIIIFVFACAARKEERERGEDRRR